MSQSGQLSQRLRDPHSSPASHCRREPPLTQPVSAGGNPLQPSLTARCLVLQGTWFRNSPCPATPEAGFHHSSLSCIPRSSLRPVQSASPQPPLLPETLPGLSTHSAVNPASLRNTRSPRPLGILPPLQAAFPSGWSLRVSADSLDQPGPPPPLSTEKPLSPSFS